MDKADSHTLANAARAGDEDQLDNGPAIGLLDVLTWLGEGKRTIAIATFAAAALAVAVALIKPNIYTARTTLLQPAGQQQSSSSAALAALGSLGGLAGGLSAKSPDELYVSLLKSDSVVRNLAMQFDLFKRYNVKSYEVLRAIWPKQSRVSSDKKSGVITVEIDDEDPKFAADLANAHATEIAKLLGRLAISEAQQRRVFFDQQLKDTKENLVKAEQTLRNVQEKSGMIVLDQQSEAIIKAVAELKAKIVEREVRLRVLRSGATAQNPDVQLLNSELAALRGELARMESSSSPSANAPAGAASSSPGIDIPIGKIPAAAIDYVRAAREVKFQETMLGSMLRQYEIAKLDEAKDNFSLQQVDVAQPPDRKSKPSRALLVLGTMVAVLIVSSLYVIWRRYSALMAAVDPGRAVAWQRLSQAWRLRKRAG